VVLICLCLITITLGVAIRSNHLTEVVFFVSEFERLFIDVQLVCLALKTVWLSGFWT